MYSVRTAAGTWTEHPDRGDRRAAGLWPHDPPEGLQPFAFGSPRCDDFWVWTCTAAKGHPGLHTAHTESGHAVKSWEPAEEVFSEAGPMALCDCHLPEMTDDRSGYGMWTFSDEGIIGLDTWTYVIAVLDCRVIHGAGWDGRTEREVTGGFERVVVMIAVGECDHCETICAECAEQWCQDYGFEWSRTIGGVNLLKAVVARGRAALAASNANLDEARRVSPELFRERLGGE
jgi:hypothetical protein